MRECRPLLRSSHTIYPRAAGTGLLSLRILVQGREKMFPAAPICVEYGPMDTILSEIKQAFLLENEIHKRAKELPNAFLLFVLLEYFPSL